MYDLFQTVLRLSLLGSGMILLLLCLKPLLTRMVSPRWQTWLWTAALLVMLLPVYQWVPVASSAPEPPTVPTYQTQTAPPAMDAQAENPPPVSPAPADQIASPSQRITLAHLACLWLVGVGASLAFLLGSYGRFCVKLLRNSIKLSEHPFLEETRMKLGIRRSIPLRAAPGLPTPMLVGILFPAVYLPDPDLADQHLRMILLHELTHYKRKDLLLKWLALLVNVIHWFNPLAWLLTRSLGQACEDACDQAVTRTMTTEERKQYMTTILTLAQA